MDKWFEFTSGQIKVLIVLCLVLAGVSVYRLVRSFSETGPQPLKLVVELGDGDRSYAPVFKVDVNLSPPDSLELVPGIGPVLAGRIIAFRDSAGPFARLDDVMKVEGIGRTTFEKIKPYLEIHQW